MTRFLIAPLLISAAAVGSCSMLDPYPTAPQAAELGAPPAQRVAMCYNTLKTSLAEAQQQATAECAAGTSAEPADSDWYLQNCPLLLPTHATFVCTKKK